MLYARNYRSQGETVYDDQWLPFDRKGFNNRNWMMNMDRNYNYERDSYNFQDYSGKFRDYANKNGYYVNQNGNYINHRNGSYANHPAAAPSSKRRKFGAGNLGDIPRHRTQFNAYQTACTSAYNNSVPHTRSNAETSTSSSCKRNRSKLEDDEPIFISKDELERYSPSRKDGIDSLRETHLRYSYCAFLQNLGMRLELPQTTIGTAMVLCHRFFIRQSHACNDRFLIATAALFLAAKSEETPRPLNDVLRVSCEIFHKQDITFLSYMLPIDWFEQYRERVIQAEQKILTTLNFELDVQHPYDSLTSVLNKLGLSQSDLVNMALNLISEGFLCWLRSSLWLQFKPHHIAGGAAYLAAKILKMDLAYYQNIWLEFQTTPAILQDVSQQLMELFC